MYFWLNYVKFDILEEIQIKKKLITYFFKSYLNINHVR